MNFRSTYLETLAGEKNRELNNKVRKLAAEYYLEVLFLQYNTLLFNCEKNYNELINYKLFADFIVPLFERKTFDQYFIILMVRSLANIILKKKVWTRLVVLRHRMMKAEENARKQKEILVKINK